MSVPKQVLCTLQQLFQFPDTPLLGQVATVSNGQPDIRTMRMYAFSDEGYPIFSTHQKSKKFEQLANNAHIAVCFLSSDCSTQVILRGSVSFEDESNKQDCWNMVPLDVRKIYQPDPSSFRIITVLPKQWEILELNLTDYPKSKKTLYQQVNREWKGTSIGVSYTTT